MKFRQPLLRSMTLEKSIIIAFDLETTGTNTSTDQIVQIAYGYYEKGELKDTVTKLFKPTIAINPGAQRVHGISMEKLQNEPYFKSNAAEIRDIFSKADGLMGYNVGFDISVIQAEFERAGIPKLDLNNVAIYDAYLIWTKHEGRSLSHAVERFLGKPMEGAHDALADITATANVFDKMVEEFLNSYKSETEKPEHEPQFRDFNKPGPLQTAAASGMFGLYVKFSCLEVIFKSMFLFNPIIGLFPQLHMSGCPKSVFKGETHEIGT